MILIKLVLFKCLVPGGVVPKVIITTPMAVTWEKGMEGIHQMEKMATKTCKGMFITIQPIPQLPKPNKGQRSDQ